MFLYSVRSTSNYLANKIIRPLTLASNINRQSKNKNVPVSEFKGRRYRKDYKDPLIKDQGICTEINMKLFLILLRSSWMSMGMDCNLYTNSNLFLNPLTSLARPKTDHYYLSLQQCILEWPLHRLRWLIQQKSHLQLLRLH
ncbi:hypothetical protein PMIT1313_00872 [Prochlorococcus marinus str. MIT 1313]|nr:hypothetical protein PMIT1313_00872 [Prochlorococcus marinus str. MIT 1313]KZR72115.1 hypothetical protein PMIT1318_01171 [Prochlorococcus marinus str. MIT 1318]